MDNSAMLYHHGILGMKWGIRRTPEQLGHPRQERQARKDAREYARAKMFYGDGAGTRRKLINNTVKERSKDPAYKKAFDEALSRQDMAKHASRAKNERKVRDAQNTAAKTGKGVINIITGHPERLGATMAGIYGAYTLAHKTGIDKVVAKTAKQKYSDIVNSARTVYGRHKLEGMLRRTMR